jgi:leader peptidase (prepilin peptidase)/N-methyltransferase
MTGLDQVPAWFINASVFIFGSVVGSFLNVCIYRMPRDESIVRPASHCTVCGQPIPWYHNIPLITYIWLRGRSSCCGSHFSVRYWVIELVTAASFLLLWVSFPPQLAAAYIVFMCFLIIATATDLEHYIIPDEITYGGAAAGIIFSAVFPQLQGQTNHLASAGLSLAGFLTAFLILWGVVELGKLAFGKKRVDFGKMLQVTADQDGISTPEERLPWDDILLRKTDQLIFKGKDIALKLGGDVKTWA